MKNAKMMAVAACVLLGSVALGLHYFEKSPSTYAECVLINMPKAQIDKAAIAIAGACKKQFPEYISYEEFAGTGK